MKLIEWTVIFTHSPITSGRSSIYFLILVLGWHAAKKLDILLQAFGPRVVIACTVKTELEEYVDI
jgi:hypothetical protein